MKNIIEKRNYRNEDRLADVANVFSIFNFIFNKK
jgi:hypothetical protein